MEIYNDTYCVYVHINKVNGKKYVGQTINGDSPQKRWKHGDGYRTQKLFYRAIQKYGWDGFDHEIVASNLTKEEANHFEELLIAKLDTMNPEKGYNLKSGGENNRLSEEIKRKIGAANKGRCLSEEQKRKIIEANTGRHLTEEHKKCISDANKGRKHTEEAKRKIGQAAIGRNVGRKHTEEALRKMRRGSKRDVKPRNPNYHPKMPVIQMNLEGDFICEYESTMDAFRKTGINSGGISNCCNGKSKSAGGYKWKYKNINIF